MRNASNAVARSIGRGIALVVVVVVLLGVAVLTGIVPWSLAP
jgi:low affinity Fe/Cu permease